jgi:hypothetical protein
MILSYYHLNHVPLYVDKDVIFPRVTNACDPAKNVTFFVKLFCRTTGSRNAYSNLKVRGYVHHNCN